METRGCAVFMINNDIAVFFAVSLCEENPCLIFVLYYVIDDMFVR